MSPKFPQDQMSNNKTWVKIQFTSASNSNPKWKSMSFHFVSKSMNYSVEKRKNPRWKKYSKPYRERGKRTAQNRNGHKVQSQNREQQPLPNSSMYSRNDLVLGVENPTNGQMGKWTRFHAHLLISDNKVIVHNMYFDLEFKYEKLNCLDQTRNERIRNSAIP